MDLNNSLSTETNPEEIASSLFFPKLKKKQTEPKKQQQAERHHFLFRVFTDQLAFSFELYVGSHCLLQNKIGSS